MVLYFTGTGNSRYLARRIAEGLETPLYDLNAASSRGYCHGITLKRWKGSSRTPEGERKLDEVFILAWVGTKTRQLGQSNKRNEGLG